MTVSNSARVGNDTGAAIGIRIKDARESLSWSVEELARRMGVTVDTINDWEACERDPRSNRIITLAGVLGVSAHWLLDGSLEFAPQGSGNPADSARAQLQSVKMKINELNQLVSDIETQLEQI